MLFETSEREELLFNLESALEFLVRTESNPQFWRWVVLAIHGALQGAMVLALQGTDGAAALTRKSERRWRKALDDGVIASDDRRLDAMPALYAKVKDSTRMESRPFAPGPTHDRSLRYLHDWRHAFLHFLPRTTFVWDLDDFAPACLDALDVVDFLLASPSVYLLTAPELARASAAQRALRRRLAEVSAGYEGQ